MTQRMTVRVVMVASLVAVAAALNPHAATDHSPDTSNPAEEHRQGRQILPSCSLIFCIFLDNVFGTTFATTFAPVPATPALTFPAAPLSDSQQIIVVQSPAAAAPPARPSPQPHPHRTCRGKWCRQHPGQCHHSWQCDVGLVCAAGECVECALDKHCAAADVCQQNVCVECVEHRHCGAGFFCLRGKCEPLRIVGEQCPDDDACHKHHCKHHRCVQCRWRADCHQHEFCDDDGECQALLATDEMCSRDDMCKSQLCMMGACAECSAHFPCVGHQFCDLGMCKIPGGLNDPCWDGSQCMSHICKLGMCQECTHHADCDHGEYCDRGACTPLLMKDTDCWKDEQCRSGLCQPTGRVSKCAECRNAWHCGDLQFCDSGNTCQPLGELDAACQADGQCASHVCGPAGTCVTCRSTKQCGPGQFCTDSGGCVPRLPDGATCVGGDQCVSLLCDTTCRGCGSDGDCSSLQFCSDGGQCAEKKFLGDVCATHGECLSASCKNAKCIECTDDADCRYNEFCSGAGVCNAKRQNGVMCRKDKMCGSGFCVKRKCVGCLTHYDCGPVQFCDDGNTCRYQLHDGKCCSNDHMCRSWSCKVPPVTLGQAIQQGDRTFPSRNRAELEQQAQQGDDDTVILTPEVTLEQQTKQDDDILTRNGTARSGGGDLGSDCTKTCSGKPVSCPDLNWASFRGNCYLLRLDDIKWTKARDVCRALFPGADLVSIHSAAENQFVFNLLKRAGVSKAWIGLNDRATENKFRWSDGTSRNFLMWANGQPNSSSKQCVAFKSNKNTWNDLPCGGRASHVCGLTGGAH